MSGIKQIASSYSPEVWHYRAIDRHGKIVEGVAAGVASEKEALAFLDIKGLQPLKIQNRPLSTVSPSSKMQRVHAETQRIELSTWWPSRVSNRDLITFASDTAILLESGISLARALSILTELNREKRTFSKALKCVHDCLREGDTFWEALDKQRVHFPPVFINMIQAGEVGGALPTILNRLAAYLDEVQELKEYVRGAMIYPIILTVTSLLSMVLMLTLVVPKFAQVFQDMGMELPPFTKIMFSMGNYLQTYWWIIAAVIVAIYVFIALALRSDTGKLFWDRWILRLPAIGNFKRKIEIARFCRTLGTLLDSGVPILQSMQIVQGVVMNSVLRSTISQAHDDLKRGEILSASLERSRLFPSLAINMIGVGEETGRLGAMLDKVGQLYDKDLKKGIKTFSSFFEPMVLLVMGVLIGGMVISMLMAIFSINDMNM